MLRHRVRIRMSVRVSVSAYRVRVIGRVSGERRRTVTYLFFVRRKMSCAMTGQNNQNEGVW